MRPVTDLQRSVAPFEVVTEMVPAGDQPQAIAEMQKRIQAGAADTVLLGATGTGKTATVAWLAERLQRPVLVMLPNKTLAAQASREQRLAIAGIVIDNSGSLAELDRQVGDLWAQLRRRAAESGP